MQRAKDSSVLAGLTYSGGFRVEVGLLTAFSR